MEALDESQILTDSQGILFFFLLFFFVITAFDFVPFALIYLFVLLKFYHQHS